VFEIYYRNNESYNKISKDIKNEVGIPDLQIQVHAVFRTINKVIRDLHQN